MGRPDPKTTEAPSPYREDHEATPASRPIRPCPRRPAFSCRDAFDYSLFFVNLKENAGRRIKAFITKIAK
jgi:hypothetical protein